MRPFPPGLKLAALPICRVSNSFDRRVRSFMLVHAAYCVDITLDRDFQNPFSATRNDTIEIMAIDRIELKRLQRDSNSSHLFRGERDQIRIAAHEAEEFWSVVTVAMSDEHNAPRPPAPLAQ